MFRKVLLQNRLFAFNNVTFRKSFVNQQDKIGHKKGISDSLKQGYHLTSDLENSNTMQVSPKPAAKKP